ncbi:MAG: sugar phosphate isomerase/epimerase family protein [Novosphingobium sp.]
MNKLGLEMLTLLGMPPVEYVKLAAELGCAEVSTGLTGLPLSMFGLEDKFYPEWSLRDDPALRREMKAAMADTGVRIGLAEGYSARSGHSVREFAGDLDLMAELGALRLNAICMEDDLAMAKDELAELAGMAAERDMVFTIEFFPPTGITSLEKAIEVCAHIGKGKARILLDTTHLFRTGGTVEQVAALDPDLIGYCQLSDGRNAPPDDAYMQTAMFARDVPGEGQLPLRDLVRVLPGHVTVSLEVPRLEDMRRMSPRDHAARCVAAAKALWN